MYGQVIIKADNTWTVDIYIKIYGSLGEGRYYLKK